MECRVMVYTGDRPRAGTDANVRIIFHDEKGTKSPDFKLDAWFRNDFERGDVNSFSVKINKDLEFGRFKKIEIWRDDSGYRADWYVDQISVEAGGEVFEFPVFRWIKPHHHYLIQHLDTALPQFDDHKQQRQMELEDKRKQYLLTVRLPGLPAQVAVLPEDEKFSKDYQDDLNSIKRKLGIDTLVIRALTEKWDDLDSMKNIYFTSDLPQPDSLAVWDKDNHFANLRVADINPVMIKLCTEIPDKLGVTEEMAAPSLEGLSLKDAIAQKRLFIADLELVDGVRTNSSDLVVCAPIALFFETTEKQLIPVAIQLYQAKSNDNPVFLPSDPEFTWMLAKMWYNNADSAYHQAVTHLGFTHLIMEGVCAMTYSNLSQSHPIFKLLAPHFLYLVAINTTGLSTLLAADGYIDEVQGTGVKGTYHLIAQKLKSWRMDVDGTLPEELKSRGVLDPSVLSYYPYRDDGLLVYNAVKLYVEKIVNLYYDSPDKLADDHEIQAWAKELVKSRDQGGCGLMGIPGNGHFTANDQLVLVFTSIICTCSMTHAAVNFPQYHTYGFPPNYPLLMKGQPPRDKAARTEGDVVASLPDKVTTLKTMLVGTLLSSRGTKSLGDFEVNFVFDPKAVEIVNEFRADLAEVSDTIAERNRTRQQPYVWLDPVLIPNSISI